MSSTCFCFPSVVSIGEIRSLWGEIREGLETAIGREVLTLAEAITQATRAKREADEKIAGLLGANALWLATQEDIIQQALDAMVMIEFYRSKS